MDDDDLQALAEWQLDGPLSKHAQARGIVRCPRCHQGYGSASLSIHVRRCRAHFLTSATEKAPKPKKVRALVDLCLRIVTKHFESICMKWTRALPEAEAALFASMPSNLTHRIVINLLQENKQEKMKNQKLDAMNKMLKNDLSDARREAAQLKKVRDNAASSRAKVASREQTIKLLRQEMDGVKSVLSSADLMNQRLRLQNEAAEKKILRLITMMNKLTAEKAKLTESWSEAVRQHTAVTRELVVANKALKTAGRSERIPTHSNQSSDYRDRQPSSSSGSLMHLSKVRSSAVYRKRPRADGSKIPYPASFKKDA